MVFNTVEDLIYAIINEIGLGINQRRFIYDQDTFKELLFSDKNIICSVDPLNPVYSSEFTIALDPILNFKLMNFLMCYYFSKEDAAQNMYVLTYNINELEKFGPSCISVRVKYNEGDEYKDISSKYYNNKSLKFCDIILRLGGYDVDLTNFDYEANSL